MNKKLLYAFVAGSLLSLSSCNDFLDVTPASGFTPDYVFSSETEMKSLMTRIYSSMTEDGLYEYRCGNVFLQEQYGQFRRVGYRLL